MSVTATLEPVIPVIKVPGDITAVSPSTSSVAVTYSVSATDPMDGTVPVTCNPASGSYFVLGATSVNCTATNSSGNSASATFHVIVTTDASGSGGGTFPSECGTVGQPAARLSGVTLTLSMRGTALVRRQRQDGCCMA
jgi:hypothetical protein